MEIAVRHIWQACCLGVTVILILAVAACAEKPVASDAGLPIDSRFASDQITGTSCTGTLLFDPLRGRLRIDADDPERVWLEGKDGRRISMKWPVGFRLELEPIPRVVDRHGQVIGEDGVEIAFEQVPARLHKGTLDDPFTLYGPIGGDCYTSISGSS